MTMTTSTLPGTRAPVRMWADPNTVEHAALDQLRNAANLPWTHGVAVMPDVHYGKGATVGSVIAMRDAVSPAAVGVDIGCGMSAVRTSLRAEHLPESLKPVRSQIERDVPVGRDLHQHGAPIKKLGVGSPSEWNTFWHGFETLHALPGMTWTTADKLRDRAEKQVGTLGGGNHFIEVCLDEDERVWLMLHSGSRNVGKVLADQHISTAKDLPHNAELPDPDLAVFLVGTPEMDAYRSDLYWAQDYARRNRVVMMALVQLAFSKALNLDIVEFDPVISCHHNYVSEETYDGLDLIITRKGAISTEGGRMGIIPGSMGTGSYIVSGLGNPAAYCSASHGAGRRMSRSQAKRTFTEEDLVEQTAGVECRKDVGVLDEIPGAYKDLEQVMSQQTDLVKVEHRLRTVLCVKG